MHLFRYWSPSSTAPRERGGRPHQTPGPCDPTGSHRPAVRPGPRPHSPGSPHAGSCILDHVLRYWT